MTCDLPGCTRSLAGKRRHARFCSPEHRAQASRLRKAAPVHPPRKAHASAHTGHGNASRGFWAGIRNVTRRRAEVRA